MSPLWFLVLLLFAPPEGSHQYTDEYEEFRWVLPGETWRVVPARDPRLKDIQRVCLRSANGWRVRLLELPVPYGLDRLEEEFDKVVPQTIPDLEVLSRERIRLSERPALRYVVKGTLPGDPKPQKALLVMFTRAGTTWVIVCQASEGTFGERTEQFEEAVKGFRLLDEEPLPAESEESGDDPFATETESVALDDSTRLRFEWSPNLTGMKKVLSKFDPIRFQARDRAEAQFQIAVISTRGHAFEERIARGLQAVEEGFEQFSMQQKARRLSVAGRPAIRLRFEGVAPGSTKRVYRQCYIKLEGERMVVLNCFHPVSADGTSYFDLLDEIVDSATLESNSRRGRDF